MLSYFSSISDLNRWNICIQAARVNILNYLYLLRWFTDLQIMLFKINNYVFNYFNKVGYWLLYFNISELMMILKTAILYICNK